MPTLNVSTDMSDLKDLEPLAKRLNAATDQLNLILQTIQDRLNDLRLGVDVWLTFECFDDHNHRDPQTDVRYCLSWELGYGRLSDGSWGLMVRQLKTEWDPSSSDYDWANQEELERTPLLRCARHHRIAAVDLLPKLIDAMREKANAVIDAVETAKKIAESLK